MPPPPDRPIFLKMFTRLNVAFAMASPAAEYTAAAAPLILELLVSVTSSIKSDALLTVMPPPIPLSVFTPLTIISPDTEPYASEMVKPLIKACPMSPAATTTRNALSYMYPATPISPLKIVVLAVKSLPIVSVSFPAKPPYNFVSFTSTKELYLVELTAASVTG